MAASRVCGKAAKHVLFAVILALFNLYLGQNWAHYSTAVMVGAWVRHKGRLAAHVW